MYRISCEVCKSNDIIKQGDVFICEHCRCKYSAEAIKKQVVEYSGSVQVSGVDTADTLYNRALEWLKLGNEQKAVSVLKEMTEKFPGDVRGWGKLARLCPKIGTYAENAARLGDDTLTADLVAIENSRLQAEAAKKKELENKIRIACDEIRKGNGDDWIGKIFSNNPDYDFPCVKELTAEAEDNAQMFNSCWASTIPSNKQKYAKGIGKFNAMVLSSVLCGTSKPTLYGQTYVFENFTRALFVIGKFVCYESINYDDDYSSGYNTSRPKCNKILNKTNIKKAFEEVERRRNGRFCAICATKIGLFEESASLCSDCRNTCKKCGGKQQKVFLGTAYYCPKCEKR